MISDRSVNEARRRIAGKQAARIVLRDDGKGGVGGVELVIGRRSEVFALAWTPRGRRKDGRAHPTRRIKLGDYVPGYGLANARRDAVKAKQEILAGGDPLAERRARKIRAATVRQLLEVYAARRLNGLRRGREQERALRKDLPERVLDLPLRELRLQHVLAVVEPMRTAQPGRAEHLWRYAAAFLSWCVDQGHLDLNPLVGRRNPVRQRSRDRVLKVHELAAVLRAADAMSPPFGPLLRVLFLTGARREEVAGMRWPELELERRLWTLPPERSKTRQSYVMPLAEPVVALLGDQRRLYGTPGEFVFTTTDGRRPVSGFSRFKKRLDAAAGVSGWVLHDARRCFASWAVDKGYPPALVDKCLNHHGAASVSTVLRVYSKAERMDDRRALLEDWARHLDALRLNQVDHRGDGVAQPEEIDAAAAL